MKTQAGRTHGWHIAREHGRRNAFRVGVLAISVAACFASGQVWALPTGAQVAAGSASFSQVGNSLTVANTPGAIINWNAFSIGALEAVRFDQQHSLSAVLNRVTGGSASAIHGALSSNGRVFLINPNGILFGAGSRIDVNGLIASTLNISDQDFRAGRLNFTAAETAGALHNAGTLQSSPGGNIYLIAPDIENSGIIRAPNGEVLLAAGRQVSLVDGGHPDIQVVVSAPSDRAVNLGEIAAGKVSVFGALLAQRGIVSADTVETDSAGRIVFRASKQLDVEAGSRTTANGAAGGTVVLQSARDTYVRGSVEATGSQGQGGAIAALGERVAVMDQAVLDASGEAGGGRVMVGGDYQGRNPDIQNAAISYFGPDATLKADARNVGAGGTVIVWADNTTRAHGAISARGGSLGGDGGFVEVSGKHDLVYRAQADTRAPMGRTGTLLLDPPQITVTEITVEASGSVGDVTGATVYGADIATALQTSNVTLQTGDGGTGNITFTAGIYDLSTAATTNGLSLLAYGGGTSTGNISMPTGTYVTMYAGAPLTLVAGWDGQSTISPQTASASAGSLSMTGSASITAPGGTVILKAADSASIGNIAVSAGSIAVTAGSLAINSALSGDLALNTTSGGIAFNTAISANSLTANAYAAIYANHDITTTAGDLVLKNAYPVGNHTADDDLHFAASGTQTLSSAGKIELGYADNVIMGGATVNLDAAGDIKFNISSDYQSTFTGNWNAVAGGSIHVQNGKIGGNAITLQGGGDINLLSGVNATGNVSLTSTDGSINAQADVDAVSGITLQATGINSDIVVNNSRITAGTGASLTAGRDIKLSSSYVEFPAGVSASNGNVTISAGRDVILDATDGGLGQDGGIASVSASSGNVSITAGGSIAVTAYGGSSSASIYSASNGDVSLGATGAVSLHAYGGNDAYGNQVDVYATTGNVSVNGSSVFLLGADWSTVKIGANANNVHVVANGGDISLANGSEISAGKDVFLTLTGAASELSLASGSQIISVQNTPPEGQGTTATTYINFTNRTTGGISIGGQPYLLDTDAEVEESSGLFSGIYYGLDRIVANTNPSYGGLVISYGPLCTAGWYCWDGGVTGNWSTLDNWTASGGAAGTNPTGINWSAGQFKIDTGYDTTWDASVGAGIAALYNSGSVTIAYGGPVSIGSLTLSGGQLINSLATGLTIGTTLSMDAASLISGFPSIAKTSGDLSLAGDVFYDGALSLDSPAGAIDGGATIRGTASVSMTAYGGIGPFNLVTPVVSAASQHGNVTLIGHSSAQPGALSTTISATDGTVSVTNYGALTLDGITAYGGVASAANSPLTVAGTVSSTAGSITLSSSGGDPLSISSAGSVSTTTGSVSMTAGSGGAVVIDGSVAAPAGSVTFAAGSAPSGSGSVTTSTGTKSGSALSTLSFTSTTPAPTVTPPPTLDACLANPALTGCAAVLPTLDACIANPATAGCVAVLPSLDACVANPAATGCTYVLPTISACIANPTAAGCAAVLPTIGTCTTNPGSEGCSAVLPTLATCTTTPAAPGCSVVLPTITACIANPAAVGCAVVLPSVSTCATNPAAPGCSVVLPTIDTCLTNPGAIGCSAVLPTLADCAAAPATPGCAAVLPPLDACIAIPTAPGCSAVLPTLASCTATPDAPGCSAVLPPLATCTVAPATPGCTAVLPPPTLPTDQQIACLADPAACAAGTPPSGGTSQAIIQQVQSSEQQLILNSQTGQAESGRPDLNVLQTASGGGVGSSGGGSGSSASGSTQSSGEDEDDASGQGPQPNQQGSSPQAPQPPRYCN